MELRLANQIGRIYFVRLNISHFDIAQNLKFFPKKLFDMN